MKKPLQTDITDNFRSVFKSGKRAAGGERLACAASMARSFRLWIVKAVMTTSEVQNVSTGQMRNKKHNSHQGHHKFISEKRLAELWDCHRSTVSRILHEKGIRPYYFGPKKRGLKRYALSDIEVFVDESKAPRIRED